jgi:hypothetical protein
MTLLAIVVVIRNQSKQGADASSDDQAVPDRVAWLFGLRNRLGLYQQSQLLPGRSPSH